MASTRRKKPARTNRKTKAAKPRKKGASGKKTPAKSRRKTPEKPKAAARKSDTGRGAKLAQYRSKRRFDRTPEPEGDGKGLESGNSFVVQKHAARRLHYDFRLELDGVMKSWAVTKGPSLDPAVKRLAVHVEDHPLSYSDFEGTIPKGEYGGGTVMVWDRGTWEPHEDPREGYAKGKLGFTLRGKRLKGGWALVRMRGRPEDRKRDNWLLIKENDAYAKPGSGDALLDKATKSALSGKTMEQLSRSGNLWTSSASAASKKPATRTVARAVKQAPKRRAQKPKAPARIKRADPPDPSRVAGAVRAPLPDFVPPQLATLAERPPTGDDWVHEIKIDGYRIYCRRKGSSVKLLTRRGNDWTERFPHVAAAIPSLPGDAFALDGEIAALDEKGVSNLGALQEALSEGDDARLVYFVFDILHLDGYDLREASLAARKEALRGIVPAGRGPVRYSEHFDAEGEEAYRQACRLGLEGVVSKRLADPYRSGRGHGWIKSKCVERQEFVIGGYTLPRKGGSGIGALLLGYYEGGELRYAGKVGTGFDAEQSMELRSMLEKLAAAKMPFASVPAVARRGVRWVRPKLVCEVAFLVWTQDGRLRHPSFKGLREDKPATEIVREMPVAAPSPSRSATPARPAKKNERASVAGIRITHPDRIIFPQAGITKAQLAEYYGAVAPYMLPHIKNRPLSLVRCPSGTEEQCFYQKHVTAGLDALPRVPIEEKKGTADYVMVRDAKDLVALIQWGVLEIHPWGSRGDDPDRPDRMIFDLDPSPGVAWEEVIATALIVREQLGELGLESFVKVTGGKGLHIVVPLDRRSRWDEVKDFARGVAARLVEARPADYTINPIKAQRGGKIFLDYLRNDRGATAVAPYSVRARPGTPVAAPVRWDEVTPHLRANQFAVTDMAERIEAAGGDIWRDMDKVRQSITAQALRAQTDPPETDAGRRRARKRPS